MKAPLLTVAIVTAHDADAGTMTVLLRSSGQVPGTVRMGYYGPADTLRVRQRPLPTRGSWGLVSFPYGDIRNGIWICTILPSQVDALTSTGAGTSATDPFIDYESTYSGFWKLLDGQGNLSMQFPDGSSFVLGSGTALPTTYRHTVSSANVREKIPFLQSDRVPNPPSAFQLGLSLKSGFSLTVDASGNATVATPGAVSVVASGDVSVSTEGSLSAAVSGSLTADVTGNSTLTTPLLTLNGNLQVNGSIGYTGGMTGAGGAGGVVASFTGAVDATGEGTFNGHTVGQHTHTQGNDSHGDTEQPTNTPTG